MRTPESLMRAMPPSSVVCRRTASTPSSAVLACAAILLVVLLQHIARIRRSVDGLLEVAGKVGANTASIPQLQATAPVLALIVEEAVVQDGYMSALTDGYGDA